MRIALAAVITSATCLWLGASTLQACSCAESPSPCAPLRPDNIVFVGTPTSVSTFDGSGPDSASLLRFTFDVDESITGDLPKSVTVETPMDGASCGFPFELGLSYVVYGYKSAGGYSTSLCSRTGLVDEKQNDLILLKQSASGQVEPRLTGLVARFQLNLDGFYMHGGIAGGVPGVPITVRGGGRTHEATTDADGSFTLVGLTPGEYIVEPLLPARYRPLFEPVAAVTLDSCLAEAVVFVAGMPLTGRVTRADGSPAPEQILIRIAQVDAANAIAFDRTTLAFTKADGKWQVPGLPPGRYIVGVNTFDPPSLSSPYPAVWHPNASDLADAEIIVVTEEQPRAIAFRLPEPLAPVIITGGVVDPQGKPIPGVRIDLHDDDDPHAVQSWPEVVESTETDNAGRFSVTGFKGRRYHVKARLEARFGSTEPERSASIPVSMETASPQVTVTLPEQ